MRDRYHINFGFVILSPEHNVGLVQSTVRSIKNHYGDLPYCCVTGKDATVSNIRELKKVCPAVYKGKETITSLINQGIKKGCKEWNYIIMEGTTMRRDIDKRYSTFLKNEKDIFFPIVVDYDHQMRPVNLHTEFTDSTLNGLFIHQKTFKEVGDFSDNPLDVSRLFWMIEAVEKGCNFKAILGAKVC